VPSLNRVERVITLMQYLQTHIGEHNTVDHISRETGIPISSIRKTIDVEFRECFDRDLYLKRIITLSGVMPYGIKFDPEPKKLKVEKGDTRRKAEYYTKELGLKTSEYGKKGSLQSIIGGSVTGRAWNYATKGVDRKDKDYWALRNAVETLLLILKLAPSKNYKRTIEQVVLDPENLPKYLKSAWQQEQQEQQQAQQ